MAKESGTLLQLSPIQLESSCSNDNTRKKKTQVAWNKGLRKETNMSVALNGRRIGETRKRKHIPPWNRGLTKDTDLRVALNVKRAGETRKKRDYTKERNKIWKGGDFPYWRKQALIRDDSTCQICGLRDLEIMEVDHIVPRAKAPHLYRELNNLMTLCPNCHRRKTMRNKENLH